MFLNSWKERFGRLHFERLNKTLIVRCQVVRDVHFSDRLAFSQLALCVVLCCVGWFSPIPSSSLLSDYGKPQLLEAGGLTVSLGPQTNPPSLLRFFPVLHSSSSQFIVHFLLLRPPWEHLHTPGWDVHDSNARRVGSRSTDSLAGSSRRLCRRPAGLVLLAAIFSLICGVPS